MAIRKIVTLGGPKEGVLRAKAKKVSRFDEHLERLVADMWQTMRDAPGVGLAAPQIGESIRVLVAEYEENAVALVNPEIIKASETTVLGTEGCLSIPGFVGDNVERHEAVVVKARNPKGKEIRVRAAGWFARVLQHEIDHLDGILYTDRIKREDVREVREEDLEGTEGAPTSQTNTKVNGKTGTRASAKAAATTSPMTAAQADAKSSQAGKGTAVTTSASAANGSGHHAKPAPRATAATSAKSASAKATDEASSSEAAGRTSQGGGR